MLVRSSATATSDPECRLRAPDVVVVVTCRNYEQFVAEAIGSVARQTYGRFRCIVVDDASTDGSRAVIARTLADLNDPRFSLLPIAENVGQLMAIRRALADNPSHFVALLDADDYWFPHFLECHIRAHLNTICSAPVTGSDACVVDGGGAVLEGTFFSLAKRRSTITHPAVDDLPDDACPALEDEYAVMGKGKPLRLSYLSRGERHWNWVNTSAIVFRRDFLDVALPDDGEPKQRHADYYLASLAQVLGGSLIMPDALGVYRMHRGNLFANLPRIGSVQNTGVEPPHASRHSNERIVLHVMKNWKVFESIVSHEVLVGGLRRFLHWREWDELAARHNIDEGLRRAISRDVIAVRAQTKSGIAKIAVKYFGF